MIRKDDPVEVVFDFLKIGIIVIVGYIIIRALLGIA